MKAFILFSVLLSSACSTEPPYLGEYGPSTFPLPFSHPHLDALTPEQHMRETTYP